ncbi:MAG: TetR/AcrR family transcriptional regulator [Deltaproteobacteria bacterium]|nr:TetR/AcrR family transcriptional regulator [Deltaproteobacteria bacterium]
MPQTRLGRTKEEVLKDFRTDEIVQAARRVIAELGFADASMERIAHEAGVAKGTIYLYFRNKEELLAHVAEHGFAVMLERARAAASRERSAEGKLAALLRAGLEHSSANQAIFRALQEQRLLAPESPPLLAATLERNLERLVSFVAGVIEQGTRSGELRACDPRRASRFLVESMRGAILERLREPSRTSVQADAEAIVDFFLHGVGATEPK